MKEDFTTVVDLSSADFYFPVLHTEPGCACAKAAGSPSTDSVGSKQFSA